MNISRINGSRVRIWHFVLQSGRGEIFRSLSTIIRSISTTTFALIDRNPLITNQVHSGRKVQLDSGEAIAFTELKTQPQKASAPLPPRARPVVVRMAKKDHPWRQPYKTMRTPIPNEQIGAPLVGMRTYASP